MMLFSATHGKDVMDFAENIIMNPVIIRPRREEENGKDVMDFAENIIMNPVIIRLRCEEESGKDVMDFAENIIMNPVIIRLRCEEESGKDVMDFAENIIMNPVIICPRREEESLRQGNARKAVDHVVVVVVAVVDVGVLAPVAACLCWSIKVSAYRNIRWTVMYSYLNYWICSIWLN
jgi:phosphoribosylformylglycinamidine (FGAM) synthase PurS component